jgi:cytochrome c553
VKPLCIILFSLLLAMCTTRKKVEYNIPADVSDGNRAIFVERFEKGKILFKSNCTECHGIYSRGKDNVPNFTKQQIDNYTAMTLANPREHSVLKKISREQLDYILTFLRLRRTAG